jgi:D-alanine-D-alanine ligase
MKIRIGFIFGGDTVEHEVSIISAVQAMRNIDDNKYEVVPIYITKDLRWLTGNLLKDINSYSDYDLINRYAKEITIVKDKESYLLKSKKGLFNRTIDEIDVAFPIVHGNNIEDGTIQGYLNLLKIPYVGSNILGSAVGQDKIFTKKILETANIKVVDYVWFYDYEYENDNQSIIKKIETLNYPVIVKPATLGSSIGISLAKNEKQLKIAIEEAIKYDKKILIEKVIKNLKEVNCSVLGNYEHALPSAIEEVIKEEDFLSYQDKYLAKGKSKGMVSTNRILPANISHEMKLKIEETSKEVFKQLNLSGVCRIDYLIDQDTNELYVNEPNTIPGSLSYYLWEKQNKPYSQLLDNLIIQTIKDYKNKMKKTSSFETNILKNFNGLKGSKTKLK